MTTSKASCIRGAVDVPKANVPPQNSIELSLTRAESGPGKAL